MSASDIAGLIAPPVVWLIGYFQYTPDRAIQPAEVTL